MPNPALQGLLKIVPQGHETVSFCQKCGNSLQSGQNPSQSTDDKPALWNPTAAANWGVFLPPLPVFLHYLNWKTLKQEKKAKTSLIWFIANFFSVGITLWIPLIAWYFVSAKGQIKYVEEKYGKTGYKKKSQLIPFVVVLATYLILVMIFIAAS